MRVGDEYRIQTEEGRNWDSEFRTAKPNSRTNPQLRRRADRCLREINEIVARSSSCRGRQRKPFYLRSYRLRCAARRRRRSPRLGSAIDSQAPKPTYEYGPRRRRKQPHALRLHPP